MNGDNVIIGTTIVRKAAFAFDNFMHNQKEIQNSYSQSKLVIATDEVDFEGELKELLEKYELIGSIIAYNTEKPDYAMDYRIWSMTFGREAIRKYVLTTDAKYLLSLDADMTYDPCIINILKKEIVGYDVVQSGYMLRSKDLNALGFGLGCSLIRREILEKIRCGCYEFKNHQVIEEGNVFEKDVVGLGAKIKKGIFLKIDHYGSNGVIFPISPKKMALFQKITTLPLLRYFLITLSIILKHDVSRSLQQVIYRRKR